MERERTETVLRARGSKGPPAKKPTPRNAKKTVSAAAIFKRQNRKTFQSNMTPPANFNSKFIVEDADASTLLSVRSRSSVQSAQQSGAGILKKRLEMHPVAIAFKDTSDEYRHHLYSTASLQINKTLETLLNSLYENTLQTITPETSQQDPAASPLRLSAPAKYERLATQLYLPISQFRLTLRRTDSKGHDMRFEQTLEKRMIHYEEHIAKQREEVALLQKQWEATVGEIWKLGVTCLGKDAMEDLLFTTQRHGPDGETLLPSSSPTKTTHDASTLFVPEHGTSPSRKARPSRKRVDFVEPPAVRSKQEATPTNQFPDFLYQASQYHRDKVPKVPALPDKEIKEIQKSLRELGLKEMDEFRQIDKDHQAYWKRKTAQMAIALSSE